MKNFPYTRILRSSFLILHLTSYAQQNHTLLPSEPHPGARSIGAVADWRYLHRRTYGSRRVPRPDGTHRSGDDRSQRHGSRRGGTARHLPHRDRCQRSHTRTPCTLLVYSQFLRSLGRIRLGHGHLLSPADCQRKAFARSRRTARRSGQTYTGTAVVHPGRDDDYRPYSRLHFHARPPYAGRLDHPSAPALYGWRGTGSRAGR